MHERIPYLTTLLRYSVEVSFEIPTELLTHNCTGKLEEIPEALDYLAKDMDIEIYSIIREDDTSTVKVRLKQ